MIQVKSRMLRTSAMPRFKQCMIQRLIQCLVGLSLLCAVSAYCQQPSDPLAESRALLAEGKLAKSEAVLHNYVKEHSTSAEAHFLLGYVLFREQKAVESLAEFTAGARTRRPKADELKAVASDYVLLHDYADADKWFTEVIVDNPDDADAWYLLGRTKYNENAFAEAVSSFERALVLRPKNIEAENNLGLAWRELNSAEKAKAAFQTAIDWQGDSPTDPQPFLNLGTMLADESNFDQAIPHLLKAAELSPDNPKVHQELGEVYEAQKNLPKAQAELERATALAPNTSSLHFELGQIYRHEGLHDQAQHEFDLCEKLNSTHSSATTPNPLASGQPAPR
jgi:tetratricopeptide (TPR) repeat protein